MKFKVKIYERLYRTLPSGYRNRIGRYVVYAGFSVSPEMYVGFSLLYGICLTFASLFLFILHILPSKFLAPVLVSVFAGFQIFTHGILVMISDNRTKFIEEITPDALRLLSANIRSGLTIDKALIVSARPEFGPLEKEFKTAAKEALSGEPVENALKKIVEKFNSKILSRSIELLIEGIRRGGDIPRLLDNLGEDIRQIKILKKEISAIVMVYAIFIFFASAIGAPVLYGVSGYLVGTMGQIGSSVDVGQSFSSVSGRMPLSSFKVTEINPEFLDLYSIMAMAVTSIFGGILMGLIQEGKETAGIKYSPLLMVISLLFYFITRNLVSSAFGILL